jgi:hypothetical protein
MPIQSKQSKSGSEAKKLAPDQRTEQRGSTWSFSSPPASSRSEIADAGSQFTITQMVAEGKRLQEEAFRARQEAGISQGVAAITEQLPRQADDDWVDVFCTATGPGTSGMLVGATPNASRAAAGTPHNIVNALFPQQIESFRACGQAHIYQYKYISICIFKRVCVLCACVNVHLYVFMCMCLSLCVCVCMCVCR